MAQNRKPLDPWGVEGLLCLCPGPWAFWGARGPVGLQTAPSGACEWGGLAHAVGALALRANSLLSGGAGWCARGARSPACEVRARAAPVTCCRPSAPQGGGLVFPGERHLPAAVRALHRVLLRHGLRPVQLLPDGARGGPCHRAGAAGGHLGQDAAHDRESGPDLRGVGHAPGQPSWPPRRGLSLHAPPLLEVGLAPGPGWHPAHSDILIPGTQPGLTRRLMHLALSSAQGPPGGISVSGSPSLEPPCGAGSDTPWEGVRAWLPPWQPCAQWEAWPRIAQLLRAALGLGQAKAMSPEVVTQAWPARGAWPWLCRDLTSFPIRSSSEGCLYHELGEQCLLSEQTVFSF